MHAIHDRVLDFIARPSPADFNGLALAVFEHQFESIDPYRRVCERRARTPASVKDWREIPPVPALAFKSFDLACGPAERVFLTTGTTRGAGERGRHCVPDLRLYRAASLDGLQRFVFPDKDRMRLLSLVAPVADRPESSLAQMIAWAVEVFGDDASGQFAAAGVLDLEAFAMALRECERSGEPACILTTTAALIRFFDRCRDQGWAFRLSHGSRLMDTGGGKGAPRHLSRRGILHAIWQTLAIPGYFCVNEYGMAELSSQFYDNVIRDREAGRFAHRAMLGPEWTRTRVLDPATMDELPTGKVGLLCHVDLANVGTAMCVLTEDIGRRVEGGFELIGRARDAEARGCSLALAEFRER
jgi:hypothetical protein